MIDLTSLEHLEPERHEAEMLRLRNKPVWIIDTYIYDRLELQLTGKGYVILAVHNAEQTRHASMSDVAVFTRIDMSKSVFVLLRAVSDNSEILWRTR